MLYLYPIAEYQMILKNGTRKKKFKSQIEMCQITNTLLQINWKEKSVKMQKYIIYRSKISEFLKKFLESANDQKKKNSLPKNVFQFILLILN